MRGPAGGPTRPSSSSSFRLEPAASMTCSTVAPGLASVLSRVRRSAALLLMAASTICLAVSWNRGVLATKSVSQFSSTRTPASVPSSSAVTRPLAAVRVARLPASLTPLTRSSSTALSKSPSDSPSAFLQSIIPAPVWSRSRLTSAAVKFAMSSSLVVTSLFGGGRVGFGRGRVRDLADRFGEGRFVSSFCLGGCCVGGHFVADRCVGGGRRFGGSGLGVALDLAGGFGQALEVVGLVGRRVGFAGRGGFGVDRQVVGPLDLGRGHDRRVRRGG